MNVLVFNAGSATLKAAWFDGAARCVLRGQVEHFGENALLTLRGPGDALQSIEIVADDHAAAAAAVLPLLFRQAPRLSEQALVVGHRLVHGGADYRDPLQLDRAALSDLERLVPLAPLHMAPALAVIRRVGAELGAEVPQFAVFDTAYFQDLPPAAREVALPREWVQRFGLRRYGFHGLAHRSLFEQYCVVADADPRRARVVSLQLGRGCSAAAINGGRALDTSMGFTPLDGLVMGTRCGAVDPGLLLHLLHHGIAPGELDNALNQRSGLAGLSGAGGDMRVLLDLAHQGHPASLLAIDAFCLSVRRYLGAYLAVLGGADAVLFGGGIGEHAARVRHRCLEHMEWAGLLLDPDANRSAKPGQRITTPDSTVAAFVLAVDEESVIASDVRRHASLNTPPLSRLAGGR